jgi:HEAT repeat protein
MPKSSWLAAVVGVFACTVALAADSSTTSPAPSSSPSVITEIAGKTLSEWMTELKNPDPGKRSIAIMNTILFGERAGEAVPLIIDRASDRDASCRAKAVIALKLMHVPDKYIDKVVRALAERLEKDGQGIVRYEAALALLRFAKDSQSALTALLAPDRGVYDTATWEIRQVCVQVLRVAGFVPGKGADPRATRALLYVLKTDTVEKVRLEATISLGAMGPPADPMMLQAVVHALDGQLAYRDKSIALWSHISLLAISDSVNEKTLQAVLKLLKPEQKFEVRMEVLHALSALGKKAKGAIKEVIDCVDDKEPAMVASACITLAAIDDDKTAPVRAALIKVSQRTDKKDREVVWYACMALSEMGKTEDVLDALKSVSQRKELDESMRDQVAKILEKVKNGKVKEPLNPGGEIRGPR